MLAGAATADPNQRPSSGDSTSSEEQVDCCPRPDSEAEPSGAPGDEDGDLGLSAGAARPDLVVLDVRNAYEWDAGHFQGANRPQEVPFCHHSHLFLYCWGKHAIFMMTCDSVVSPEAFRDRPWCNGIGMSHVFYFEAQIRLSFGLPTRTPCICLLIWVVMALTGHQQY